MGKEQHELLKPVQLAIDELRAAAQKEAKRTIFCFGTTRNINNPKFFVSSLRRSADSICLNVMLTSTEPVAEICSLIDGRVDRVYVDVENKIVECADLLERVTSSLTKSSVTTFRGNEVTAHAVEAFISGYFLKREIRLAGKRVLIAGCGHLGAKVAIALAEHRMRIDITRRDPVKGKKLADATQTLVSEFSSGKISFTEKPSGPYLLVVGAAPGVTVVTPALVEEIETGGVLIDLGLNTIEPAAVAAAKARGIPTLCAMIHPAFSGLICTLEETDKLLSAVGAREANGIRLVSGGLIGTYGDFIVDHFERPTRLIAIAKGNGLVLNSQEKVEFKDKIEKFEKSLIGGTREN
jgi:hypothetical protein